MTGVIARERMATFWACDMACMSWERLSTAGRDRGNFGRSCRSTWEGICTPVAISWVQCSGFHLGERVGAPPLWKIPKKCICTCMQGYSCLLLPRLPRYIFVPPWEQFSKWNTAVASCIQLFSYPPFQSPGQPSIQGGLHPVLPRRPCSFRPASGRSVRGTCTLHYYLGPRQSLCDCAQEFV